MCHNNQKLSGQLGGDQQKSTSKVYFLDCIMDMLDEIHSNYLYNRDVSLVSVGIEPCLSKSDQKKVTRMVSISTLYKGLHKAGFRWSLCDRSKSDVTITLYHYLKDIVKSMLPINLRLYARGRARKMVVFAHHHKSLHSYDKFTGDMIHAIPNGDFSVIGTMTESDYNMLNYHLDRYTAWRSEKDDYNPSILVHEMFYSYDFLHRNLLFSRGSDDINVDMMEPTFIPSFPELRASVEISNNGQVAKDLVGIGLRCLQVRYLLAQVYRNEFYGDLEVDKFRHTHVLDDMNIFFQESDW